MKFGVNGPPLGIIGRMRRSRARLGLFLFLLVPASARAEEALRYRWRLDGFLGALASAFVPSGGEGLLTVGPQAGGLIRSELLVTSTESAKGDYFRYGAEWQADSGRTVRAWSDQVWRGEKKSKETEVEEEKVTNIVSAIEMLRRDPPTAPKRLEIWSDGRLYPVLVLPRGTETRKLDGKPVPTTHLEVRGLKLPDRKIWKGELDLWIANDPLATPVEIQVEKKGVRVRLIFVGRGAGESPSPVAPATPGGGG